MVGIVLTYEIDDAALSAALGRAAAAGADLSPAMSAISTHLETATRLRFETESGPTGAKWKPSRRVIEEGGQTLTLSGDLKSSIGSAFTPTTAEAGPERSFGSAVYAAIHQFGGVIRPVKAKALHFGGRFLAAVTIPARPYVGWSEGDKKAAAEILTDHLQAAFAGGSGPGGAA